MREHGTRACYVHGPAPGSGEGCRCEPCRQANRDYVDRVKRQQLYGRWEPWVDEQRLAEVREHLRALSRAGVGTRAIAEASGVARTSIERIRRGRIRRIREHTARAILAVTTSTARLPHSLVDGAEAWRLIEELLAVGWRRYQIAHELGNERPALQLRRDRVLWRHEQTIRALHDREWETNAALREVCRCYAAIQFERRRERDKLAKREARAAS